MMRSRYAVAAVTAMAFTACNPFQSPFKGSPAVEVNRDRNVNARWHGELATPASLAGAVQINGAIAMTPSPDAASTRVTMNLANATPGGVHPWQVHMGQCGTDEGVFGSASAYQPLKIDGDGKATVSTTIGMPMPSEGRYYVSVSASPANPETIVACGNMAAPSR